MLLIPDSQNRSLLVLAAELGHIVCVTKLLSLRSHSANRSRDDISRALSAAWRYRHSHVAKILTEWEAASRVAAARRRAAEYQKRLNEIAEGKPRTGTKLRG